MEKINEFNTTALYVESRVNGWNKINDYSINEVLEGLGFNFDTYKWVNDCGIKEYINANGNIGDLILSANGAPVFYEKTPENKVKMIIIFNKIPQIIEYIYLPHKDLGVVELGIDLLHPDLMQFYDETRRIYNYSQERYIDREQVPPNEIKESNADTVIGKVNEVHLWSSEIRRNLAPKSDIVIKKQTL